MKLNYKFVLTVTLIVLLIYTWYNIYNESSKGYLINIEPSSFIERKVVTKGLLDLNDFHLLLVPRNVCKSSDDGDVNVKYVQIITSYAGEVTARSALRRAYPSSELLGLGISRVFLLARTRNKTTDVTQAALEDENRKFGDLLQGSFYESYRNLTYKHAMGLKWASNLCPQIKYILKMDDDIVVDLYRVLDVVRAYERNSTFDLMGYVFDHLRPIRMKANKWYVTKQEYDRNYYPKFLSGWFYVTKPKVAFDIVERARSLPYFWIDDVFLTGIVPETLGSSFLDIRHHFTTYPELLDCCITRNVACEFSVAPSGGDHNLQIRFQKHSKKCSLDRACTGLPSGVNISQVCVAKKVMPQLSRGLPSIKIIKL
uniref:Hexosyltransferase n=2 Tax=Lygus hesperus TaxID=30085 RepID=A0A146LQ42_LYGHE